MTTPKRPRDPNQLAKFIVDVATGGAEDHAPDERSSASRRGGLMGGPARARVLTAEQRKAIAEKAANSRWKKDHLVPEKKE